MGRPIPITQTTMKKTYIFASLTLLFISCNQGSKLPAIAPDVITEKTVNDTDDPAIWIHPQDPSKSIVFGTDKDTNGAVFAFDLQGKIIHEKSIKDLRRPNNVDVEYGFRLNDSTTVDVLMFTEREKQQIRLFSVPDMQPLDGGGFPVFVEETDVEQRLPMGISIYKSPKDSTVYAIVGRKIGPSGTYLHQYKLVSDSTGVRTELVREFGEFSGTKEIEAIAVDDELGYIYYSDEGICVRKYHAEPDMGNQELGCMWGEYFQRDIEGIAIATYPNGEGYIIVSDQQRGQFNIFSRKDNLFVKAVNLSTLETDGCEVVTVPLNETFPNGLFVSMNDERDFYYHDLGKLLED